MLILKRKKYMAQETSISKTVVIESIPMAIKGLIKDVLSAMHTRNFSEEDVFAVHLALQEACMNAIEHGNDLDPDKHVTVDYSVTQDKIEISITDEGPGFDPEVVPDPRCGKNLYKANGRGLLLIRSYMDVVEYSKKGTCLHLVRHKEKPRVTIDPNQNH